MWEQLLPSHWSFRNHEEGPINHTPSAHSWSKKWSERRQNLHMVKKLKKYLFQFEDFEILHSLAPFHALLSRNSAKLLRTKQ